MSSGMGRELLDGIQSGVQERIQERIDDEVFRIQKMDITRAVAAPARCKCRGRNHRKATVRILGFASK